MRCIACDNILLRGEMYSDNPEYCNYCKGKSNEQYTIFDRDYVHGELTGIHLDGSTLTIDTTVFDEGNDEY